MLKDNDLKFGAYQIGNGKIRVQMNGKLQLNLWLNKIGFSNVKHIFKARRALMDSKFERINFYERKTIAESRFELLASGSPVSIQ